MAKQYIHYGSSNFKSSCFEQINNHPFRNKPIGGLWASPIGDNVYSWDDWCRSNDWNIDRLNESFIFELKDGSKVLRINSRQDVYDLPKSFLTTRNTLDRHTYFKQYKTFREFSEACDSDAVSVYLDFETILDAGYDAIEYSVAELYFEFYGWDCDCILVLNPDSVVPIKKKESLMDQNEFLQLIKNSLNEIDAEIESKKKELITAIGSNGYCINGEDHIWINYKELLITHSIYSYLIDIAENGEN